MPSDSSGFGYRRSGILALDGPATQPPSPPANHRRVNDPHYVEWPYGAALRARLRVSHAVASAPAPWKQIAQETRPSSRRPPSQPRSRGDAVREIWRRNPEGQSEMDEHVPPNVVPDVPLLSQAELKNCG